MFTLLNPAALLALLGLLVPLAIHLWNRRPGREVAVGSLRWLAAGANRRLRNLKLEQLWLLLLRAALLAVLALALADPVRRQRLPASRGQVLLSPAVVGSPAFATLRPAIDSLRRQGYVLRWLTAGFPKLSGAAWQANAQVLRDSARILSTQHRAAARLLWTRVQQAADKFSGEPLYVLTLAELRGFQGQHRPLPATVTWQTLPLAMPAPWLHAAAGWGDRVRLLVGQTNETQTSFRSVSIPRPKDRDVLSPPNLSTLSYFSDSTGDDYSGLKGPHFGQALGVASNSGILLPSVPIRALPLRITIYATSSFAPDARFLQAALRAAAVGVPVPLVLTMTTRPPNPAAAPDWLFWLSDAPLPAAWQPAVKAGAHVWQEAAGAGIADASYLAFGAEAKVLVTVFRRANAAPNGRALPADFPLWTDGQGRPVLTRRRLGNGAIYQLHTRLNPEWSELADSPALPAQLLLLLQPALTDAAAPPETALDSALSFLDQRALDPVQLQSGSRVAAKPTAATTTGVVPPAFRQTDLRPWLVLVAGLLFLLERLLARRRDSQTLPSAS